MVSLVDSCDLGVRGTRPIVMGFSVLVQSLSELMKTDLTRMMRRSKKPSMQRISLTSRGRTIHLPSPNVSDLRFSRPKCSPTYTRCKTSGGRTKRLKFNTMPILTMATNSSAH